MEPIHLYHAYRPLRIGWCIRRGSLDDFRQALRLSHCLWGGTYNPLVVTDRPDEASQLASLFRLDALVPASGAPEVMEFPKSFPGLLLPSHLEPIGPGNRIQLLDFEQCVWRIQEYKQRQVLGESFVPLLPNWQESDPLADVFLATFGDFASPDLVGRDYAAVMLRHLDLRGPTILEPDKPLPRNLFARDMPTDISKVDLRPSATYASSMAHLPWSGVYVGSASEFDDLVTYWNLCACGFTLLFYDSTFEERLGPMVREYLDYLRRSELGDEYFPRLFCRRKVSDEELGLVGHNVTISEVSELTWDWHNLVPEMPTFDGRFTQGMVNSGDGQAWRLTVPVPAKPFLEDDFFRGQYCVTTVTPTMRDWKDRWTFSPPMIRALNNTYGRKMLASARSLRSQYRGVAVIEPIDNSVTTLIGLGYPEVALDMFDKAGMKGEISEEGLLVRRLVEHMGSLRECRILRIPGVRKLLTGYAHDASFTTQAAHQEIGPGLDRFRGQGIMGFREPTAQSLFSELLERKLVRAGRDLRCPDCGLKGWYSLDRLGTVSRCEFCGTSFDPTPQLPDGHWAYRRTPLCGTRGRLGVVPATLVLHQLEATLKDNIVLWAPGLELTWDGDHNVAGEIDVFAVCRARAERVAVLLGEVKTNTDIEEDQVHRLAKMAQTLEKQLDVDPYLLFAKMGSFSPSEIELFKSAQPPHQYRVILLDSSQLEPRRVYEWSDAPERFRHVSEVETLAEATSVLFLRDV